MSEAIEYLSFEVSGEGFAIDIALTREIRGWTEPSAMPDTEDFELGVINLRGEMLPLIDLAARLGLPSLEIHARSVIIVAEVNDIAVGLLVDSVSNIIALSEDDLRAPPAASSNGKNDYVKALTVVEEQMIRIIDLGPALAQEREAA